jgi:cobalt/nickel transport system ATP-binding protein
MPITHPQPSQTLPRQDLPCDEQVPVLYVEGLNFYYSHDNRVLKDINLCLSRGEKAALVGPNGAGKSTFLLHLNGILRGEGKILVNSLPVIKENLAEIRAQVGLVFQNPDDQLFSPTVYEDVAFGPLHMGLPEGEIHQRVTEALQMVAMNRYTDRLSHHLSMGEKKRIAIASVLSMEPEILVLDEPTSGLDPRARRSLIGLLKELPQTMLVSTHDMFMVKELFPRMVVMDEGRIVADGRSDAILANPDLLEAHGLEAP